MSVAVFVPVLSVFIFWTKEHKTRCEMKRTQEVKCALKGLSWVDVMMRKEKIIFALASCSQTNILVHFYALLYSNNT